MTNHHLSPAARAGVRQALKDGDLTVKEIAAAAGCGETAVRYQRDLMVMAGELKRDFLPAARDYERPRERGGNAARVYIIPQVCIVGGCQDRRTNGPHCDDHQTAAQIARATAGMSEATRRKLTGGRA